MAVSADYIFVDTEKKLEENLKWSFSSAFDKNEKFEQAEGVNTVVDWYKEVKEFKEKRREGGDNKSAILSVMANKTIEELVKYVEPFYTDTIIKNIGIKTQLKEGVVLTNFNIGCISIKPFVKFVKHVNGKEIYSAKFRFQLDTTIYIDKLQIHNTSEYISVDIEKIGIELELSLLQVSISPGAPAISLIQPIKLIDKRFEINDLSLHSRKSSTKVGAINSLTTIENKASYDNKNDEVKTKKSSTTSKTIIVCQNCGNQNQTTFKFCNICGTSLQISCQSCGNINPSASVYCSKCGFALRR